MKVSRENWQAFAVDYYDGNLSKEQEEALFAFFKDNPDLKSEFDDYEPLKMEPENVTPPDFSGLKRKETVPVGPISEENYTEYFVLYLDGELNEKEKTETELFINENPHLKNEFAIWQQTSFTPDKTVVFPHKENLKKRPLIIPVWMLRSLVAALFIAGIVFTAPRFFPEKKRLFSGNKISSVPAKTVNIPIDVKVSLYPANITHRTGKLSGTSFEKSASYNNSVTVASLSKASIKNPSPVSTDISNSSLILPRPLLPAPPADILLVEGNGKNNGSVFKKTSGRLLGNIQKLLARRKRMRKEKGNNAEPAGIKVLETGISAFNKLTGADVITARMYNGEGEFSGYQIVGNNWQISRKIYRKGGTW